MEAMYSCPLGDVVQRRAIELCLSGVSFKLLSIVAFLPLLALLTRELLISSIQIFHTDIGTFVYFNI